MYCELKSRFIRPLVSAGHCTDTFQTACITLACLGPAAPSPGLSSPASRCALSIVSSSTQLFSLSHLKFLLFSISISSLLTFLKIPLIPRLLCLSCGSSSIDFPTLPSLSTQTSSFLPTAPFTPQSSFECELSS